MKSRGVRATPFLAAAMILGALSGCASSPREREDVVSAGYLTDSDRRALTADVWPSEPHPENKTADLGRIAPATDRWWLAVVHAETRPPEALQHFDCALGTRLMSRPRPHLTRLMTRLSLDAASVTAALAREHPRQRPIAAPSDLQACQRLNEDIRQSPSWPAGAAVLAAAWAEALAELTPDKAEAVRRAGREMSQSRVICRMNWPSDVTDGARLGRALHQIATTHPDYEAEADAARAELAAARAEDLRNPGCAAERRAYGDPAWGL